MKHESKVYHLYGPGPGPVRLGALRRQNLLWVADELSSGSEMMAGCRENGLCQPLIQSGYEGSVVWGTRGTAERPNMP